MISTIISAIIVLGVLIIFHEFGHFLFAKLTGIRVEEFSVGFGPKIIQIKKGETIYKLCLVPLGGYVKLAGMESKEILGEPYEFASKSTTVKIGTVIAGPIFNYVLALLLFIWVTLVFGVPSIPTRIVKSANNPQLQPRDEIILVNGEEVETWDDIIEKLSATDSAKCVIKRNGIESLVILSEAKTLALEPLIPPIMGKVVKNGPAWKAGIREGDSIIKVNNDTIQDWDSFVSIIHKNPGKELLIGWFRNGNYIEGKAVPDKEEALIDGEVQEIGMLKVQMQTGRKQIGIKAVKEGFIRTTGIVVLTFSFFEKLLTRKISHKTLGGPVAIIKFAAESAKWGIESLIIFIGLLSIQLFIFNLIPFPPLDGGQVLLIIIEKIKKSPISQRTIRLVQSIGFAILIMLIFYITINDIARILK